MIWNEHDALSAMLQSICLLLAQHRRGAIMPGTALPPSVPAKHHHRKQARMLLPKVRARTPVWRELFNGLANLGICLGRDRTAP
ncbi:hypothetical protein QTI66_29970 [Variovorax sp. J22R133]|uniref:hypothetical protein n=1 Tax=Variovorax brevis TaxID=3053503 RepID=UPI00257523BD|nr:hypothetical protein [Variovorax sp. J22R133]MDM0116383.1 hypothetical protein [Variovorax sp. J22R133]